MRQENRKPVQTDWKAKSQLTESLVNASIDSLVALDTQLAIQVWNNAATIWTGLQQEEVLGRYFFDVFPDALKTPGLENGMQQALLGRKVFIPAGEGFYLEGHYECHLVPLKNNEDNITGVLQVLHDVAHRVKNERELKALNRQLALKYAELKHANEELATFAKIASHDLKEPLRKIYTFAELIMMHESSKLSNNGRANFRRIQKSLQRMALLTDDIVNFSELSLGREALQLVNLFSAVCQAAEQLKTDIAQTGALLVVEDLPEIVAQPALLLQLIRQILSNAIKFRQPQTTPIIQISCEEKKGSAIKHPEALPEAYYYCLSFQDNGIGFEPEYSEKIFRMFERLAPEGHYKGSGMGLALAQKAARMHAGFIVAESRGEEGSVFHCFLQDLS